MRSLPNGTVTFLFTDVEGSTRLLHELGDEAYATALAEHRRIVRDVCGTYGGVEVDTQGDAFFVAFASALDAVQAAQVISERLEPGRIRVRIGLHTGTPLLTEEGYVGHDVHFAARVAASGHGGQILVSVSTVALIESSGSKGHALSLLDLGEHGLKDIDESVSLYQLGDGSFPPLKTISNTNLPRPASSFVGRERELQEVLARVQGGARLLTLTGPGGSGKTRLALEVAASLVPEYKAGVFWVGLAALRDPALVSETIAQTLSSNDGLAEHIGKRELLLLLDNLEQVIESAPELSSLLTACPNLTLLVTSRERLRVQGEVEYPVPPLAEHGAVSLFCERAQLDPTNEISELCSRLDNLPLAVELAAGRTTALSPAQIVERLSQRLDLLKGGRDADPRQQTLRATIEWSYELLSEEEQQLFHRVSVFAGGGTLEASEEVCGADLDTLQSLVEKSLVRFSNERYWMLETIREYAGERLEESGEAGEVRQRHADRFLALGEEAAPFLRGADAARWFDRLQEDLDNIRMALDFFALVDPERELRLATAVSRLWWLRGYLTEGRRCLEGALDRAASSAPPVKRAEALHVLEFLASSQGDYEGGRAFAEAALRIHRDLGDEGGEAGVLNTLAANAMSRGDHGLAQNLFEQSRAIFAKTGNEWGLAMTVGNLGELALETGNLRAAVEHLEESIVLAQRGSWDEGSVATLCALGAVRLEESRSAEAFDYFRESVGLARQLGHVEGVADCLDGFAGCASVAGNLRRAARLLAAADSLREDAGVASGSYLARYGERRREEVREGLGDKDYLTAVTEGRAMSVNDVVEYALTSVD
jgi:predicted ATPase/class 3 adenylate cyclase